MAGDCVRHDINGKIQRSLQVTREEEVRRATIPAHDSAGHATAAHSKPAIVTATQPSAGTGLGGAVTNALHVAASEASVLLVGDVGLASSR